MHRTNIGVALNPNFINSFMYSLFKYAFSSIALRILNLYNKRPTILAIDIIGLKCCLHPYTYMSKTTCPQRPSQQLFDYDCITL